ncbi:hypothetical protein QOT17_009733 [Balamuthia mandrillaris]
MEPNKLLWRCRGGVSRTPFSEAFHPFQQRAARARQLNTFYFPATPKRDMSSRVCLPLLSPPSRAIVNCAPFPLAAPSVGSSVFSRYSSSSLLRGPTLHSVASARHSFPTTRFFASSRSFLLSSATPFSSANRRNIAAAAVSSHSCSSASRLYHATLEAQRSRQQQKGEELLDAEPIEAEVILPGGQQKHSKTNKRTDSDNEDYHSRRTTSFSSDQQEETEEEIGRRREALNLSQPANLSPKEVGIGLLKLGGFVVVIGAVVSFGVVAGSVALVVYLLYRGARLIWPSRLGGTSHASFEEVLEERQRQGLKEWSYEEQKKAREEIMRKEKEEEKRFRKTLLGRLTSFITDRFMLKLQRELTFKAMSSIILNTSPALIEKVGAGISPLEMDGIDHYTKMGKNEVQDYTDPETGEAKIKVKMMYDAVSEETGKKIKVLACGIGNKVTVAEVTKELEEGLYDTPSEIKTPEDLVKFSNAIKQMTQKWNWGLTQLVVYFEDGEEMIIYNDRNHHGEFDNVMGIDLCTNEEDEDAMMEEEQQKKKKGKSNDEEEAQVIEAEVVDEKKKKYKRSTR